MLGGRAGYAYLQVELGIPYIDRKGVGHDYDSAVCFFQKGVGCLPMIARKQGRLII